VEEVGAAADAADAARVAVELLLAQVVVEEAAAQACVRAEADAAGRARRADRLPQPAQRALQLAHRGAVQLVPLGGVLLRRAAASSASKHSAQKAQARQAQARARAKAVSRSRPGAGLQPFCRWVAMFWARSGPGR